MLLPFASVLLLLLLEMEEEQDGHAASSRMSLTPQLNELITDAITITASTDRCQMSLGMP